MHNSGPTRSAVIITIALYGACIAHLFIRVCAWVYNNILPSIFAHHRGHQCLPQMMEVFSHLRLNAATTKQRHAVRPGSLGPHGVWTNSTLTSANRQSPGHGLGVRCRVIRITGFVTRRFRSLALVSWMYSEAAYAHGGRVVWWPRPNQSDRFG